MKKTLLSILGLAAATLATVTLLGQAEASSSSGGNYPRCAACVEDFKRQRGCFAANIKDPRWDANCSEALAQGMAACQAACAD